MTATERAKRSDALYYETFSVTRRVLCDMIANREADLEDAKAESEHMRLKALAVAGELQEESERLKSENAKLRELAARAYKTARMMCEAWDGPCQSNSDVPSWRVPCPTDERDEQCVFGQLERDMRELGVVVC